MYIIIFSSIYTYLFGNALTQTADFRLKKIPTDNWSHCCAGSLRPGGHKLALCTLDRRAVCHHEFVPL